MFTASGFPARAAVIFVLCFFSVVSAQQEEDESANYLFNNEAPNVLRSVFFKQLNTYNLNSTFNFSRAFDPFFFNIYENYNSTIIKSSTKNIRDEQTLSLRGGYKISPLISTGLAANSRILSDDRNLALNSSANNDASAFIMISPINNFYISPYLGYSSKEQIGKTDQGLLYGIESRLSNFNFSDLQANSSFSILNEDIMPRRNLSRVFNADLSSHLDNNIYNILSVGFLQKRNDYYYTDSTIFSRYNMAMNIQSRSETNYAVRDRLKYDNFLDVFLLDASVQASWRKIDRDSRYKPSVITESTFGYNVDAFRLDLESSIAYYSEKFDAAVRFSVMENEERYAPKKIATAGSTAFEDRSKREYEKNNVSERMTLSLTGNWSITKKDRIVYAFTQSKYVYDTPAEENYDDRDELLSIGRIEYRRKLTPYFDWFLNFEGSISSLNYIFSERSSNNNVKRVIAFSSGGYFKNGDLISKNTFTTTANYTVYDFEKLNSNLQSFSFRQLMMSDSTSLKLGKDVSARFLGYLKLSEQGNFNWSAFSEKPLRSQTEIYAEPVIYVKRKSLSYGVGVRLFKLISYLYNGAQKNRNSDYQSIGPLTDVQYRLGDLNISLLGWYEFISTNSVNTGEIVNLNFIVNWDL